MLSYAVVSHAELCCCSTASGLAITYLICRCLVNGKIDAGNTSHIPERIIHGTTSLAGDDTHRHSS